MITFEDLNLEITNDIIKDHNCGNKIEQRFVNLLGNKTTDFNFLMVNTFDIENLSYIDVLRPTFGGYWNLDSDFILNLKNNFEIESNIIEGNNISFEYSKCFDEKQNYFIIGTWKNSKDNKIKDLFPRCCVYVKKGFMLK